jgi:hypothetical protein
MSRTEKLQTDLDTLEEWAVENEKKINLNKSKAISFTRARGRDPLKYCLRNKNIPEANFCKYLGIIVRSDLSWAGQVDYTVQRSLEGTTFCNAYCKKGK